MKPDCIENGHHFEPRYNETSEVDQEALKAIKSAWTMMTHLDMRAIDDKVVPKRTRKEYLFDVCTKCGAKVDKCSACGSPNSPKPPKPLRLHSHPQQERDLGVQPGHVIIDSDVFFRLINIHGPYVEPDSEVKI